MVASTYILHEQQRSVSYSWVENRTS